MNAPAPLSLEAAYRALDPQGALESGAAAYTPRPGPLLATLVTQLRLDHRPGLHLLSGHIGSGKTTELRRLEAALRPATRARLVTLDGIPSDGKLAPVEVASNILFAMDFLGDHAPRRVDGDAQDFVDTIHEGFAELARKGLQPTAPPIILLDGLDKLSLGEIETMVPRMISWGLPLSLVTTVPLSYLFTPSFSRREGEFAGIHVVPALPVIQRDLHINPPTVAWFSNVLVNRGVRELFDDDAAELIALMTAGIIRDFVRSCREAVLTALVQGRPRVDLEMARIALDEFALRMTRPVSGDDLRVLNVVVETGRVVGHATFLSLIDGGQIVEYRNGSNWYAVHPLLRDIVARFAQELAS